MSKRMSEIQTEFNEAIRNVSDVTSNVSLIDIASITTETIIENIYNSDTKSFENKATGIRYKYKGTTSDNYDGPCVVARNNEIRTNISTLSRRISEVNSLKTQISNISSECDSSLADLNSDKSKATQLIAEYNGLAGEISSINIPSGYGNAFGCEPSSLLGNIQTVGRSISSYASSDKFSGIMSKLDNLIKTGENIKKSIESYKGLLDNAISKFQQEIAKQKALMGGGGH